MRRFKDRCVELRQLDHTLLEIAAITGRAKSSVYAHIKDMPLSLEKQRLIKANHSLRLSAYSGARKGKSNRKFKEFLQWNGSLVNLISHLIFDGEIKHSGCVYNNRNQSLLDRVEKSMGYLYKFEPVRYTNPLTGVKRISYFNVALSIYFKQKANELLKNIETFSKSLKKEMLKAFFDDEGCIDFRKKRNLRRVRGYQKDMKILLLIKKLLANFGIASNIHRPNEVVITGKENLKRFQKEINFSPGVYINGNRSNSIWKKSLEKRDILDLAIKSFKT